MNKMVKVSKDYVYIYNSEQVKFYINECGLKIVDMGTGNKGDAFVKFIRDDLYVESFKKWCDFNRK